MSTELFKILSDETRLRITNLIFHQDLCVCELTEILDLSQPKISKHIAKLRTQNLVNTERNEQYIYYSINKQSTYYVLLSNILQQMKEQILIDDLNKLQSIEQFVCTRP
jgi:ArsR family transcriptional regulator